MRETRKFFGLVLMAAALAPVGLSGAARAATENAPAPPTASTAGLSTIRGVVRDERGNPISKAVVALWREGVATVREVTSATDGSFVARVLPGRYSLTAMATGFSVVSLSNVEVGRADDVAYQFNLVRTGSGATLPERRADRNNQKWIRRATRRSIYQNNEGAGEKLPDHAVAQNAENAIDESSDIAARRSAQTAVETYFAASANQNAETYFGVNFATVQPINDRLELVFAGQTGIGEDAPQRLETIAKVKLNERHRLSFSAGGGKLGAIRGDKNSIESDLGQFSFQAVDEWRVRDGVILVLGVDYSRFVGASDADSISPRLGLQFDANSKTRFSAAYTTQNESRSWQQAADLEDSRVLFRQPNFDSLAQVDNRIVMPKMRRLEFGVERVLDNSSSLEATAFFDATTNRGISLINLPNSLLDGAASENQFSTGLQNGSAQGVRVVYSRRLNSTFSASLGYSAGRGQKLSSAAAVTDPDNLFENAFFQTLAAQVSSNFSTGTEVQTIFRLSPEATVFAVDPFAGRLAVYDPSLSILVAQKLPTWGLPVRAKAVLDARNLFDFQSEAAGGEQTLRLNSARRMLRGGIALRF